MSVMESRDGEEQFVQQIPEKRESVTLDKRYKSIGISAVNAAAAFKSGAKRKSSPDQMS